MTLSKRPSKGYRSGVALSLVYDALSPVQSGANVTVAKETKRNWKWIVPVANCRAFSTNFCWLSVFWKKISACFRSHVACRFYRSWKASWKKSILFLSVRGVLGEQKTRRGNDSALQQIRLPQLRNFRKNMVFFSRADKTRNSCL